ncbi:MAG: S8 family serine peptidase [Erysipelotrichaceae bacterium]|nr:S8 family serine peptidase [Erysipelotrichaceae bacterium]
MKEHNILRKLASLVLTLLLVVTGTGVASAKVLAEDDSETVTFEQVENEGKGRLFSSKEAAGKISAEPEAVGGMVRVSIVLEDKSTIGAGYATENIGKNASAKQYRAGLKAKQDAMAKTISQEVLNGENLDVVWNITLAGNMISANVPYDKIDEIKTILGVKDVIIETSYAPDVVSVDPDDPNMGTATEMTGGSFAWAQGYTGAGSKVAIIDTGLDTDHELFDPAAFDVAIAEDIENGKTVNLMTEADVKAVWDQLNASAFLRNSRRVYLSTKVPYAINYVDKDLDVTHDNDSQGEHGSHVAGIATGNRYVTDDNGGYVQSLYKDGVFTQGEAPDAQLLIMKVFGKGGGAYDSDYFVAIEDAIVLGADSVNLSLGSASAGMVTTAYQDILDELSASATITTNSAGNNYDWTRNNNGVLYDDDINYHTGGSPGSFGTSFTTASIDNKGATGNFFGVAGKNYVYDDGSSANNAPMTSIAGEYEYVFLDGPGVDDNNHVGQEGDTFFALGEDIVAGKVAICSRGSSSFFAKANAAMGAGAVAIIIYNNTEGTIGMNLTGYTYTNPAVSITQADGLAIKAASTEVTSEDGIPYYTGTITIADRVGVSNPGDVDYYTMSDFSSWGVPGDLSLKPEITAPGGNIWSVNGAVAGGKAYENMSGTSMAAPQMAGVVAVFNQYAREHDLPAKTGKTLRQLALSMLMSTAKPVEHQTKGLYSILKQGAGLVDVNAAINAKAYITIDSVADAAPLSAADSIADGKVKVELGEVREDSFTTTFTLHNFSDEDVQYYLSARFFTQKIQDGYRLQDIEDLDLEYTWKINGYDFDANGTADELDAQYLLEYVDELHNSLADEDLADLDNDGDIDTYDARLAFELLAYNGVIAKAGDALEIELTVSGLNAALGDAPNGNYIEGYIYAQEGEAYDGALGVTHSIPVLGFYGNWTDASMYDKMNLLDVVYEEETREPYLGTVWNSFLIQYPGDSEKHLFGGNPVIWDEEYMPERNAMSSDSKITDLQYVQIRNAAASRLLITKGNSTIYTQVGGASLGAYYHRNQAVWKNISTSISVNYSPARVKEGTALNLKYQLAPEYYVNEDGTIRWDDLGDGAEMSVPVVIDNTAPYIVDVDFANNVFTVVAHDNQYIAAVALFTDDGTTLATEGSKKNVRKGEQVTYEFDLSELEEIPAHYLVEIYDYATNLTTYKLNLNTEELDQGLQALSIDPEEALIMKGSTVKLTVTADPWGGCEDVTWVSGDERIALVDGDGIVTGTGSGTTTITAISDEDPSITAEATITVKAIETTIVGGVQGVDGSPVLYTWDLDHDDTYTEIGELENGLTAMAYDWMSDDGQYFYQQDWEGFMYQVDVDTLEAVAKSKSTTAFGAPMEDIDFPFLYNASNGGHLVFGVSEGYLLLSADIMENTFNRGYSLASYLANYTGASQFVAIAWGGADMSEGCDYLYALDNAGYLWEFDYYTSGSLYLGYIETDLQMDYPLMDETTGNSLLLGDDGEFYLAHYDGSTSVVYQLAYEDGQFVSYRAGDFGPDVWPATLISALDNNASDGSNALRPAPEFVNAFTMVAEDLQAEDFAPVAENADGGLDSIRAGEEAGTDGVSTDVTINVTADELSKNGKIAVVVPATARLTGWNSNAEHKTWNDSQNNTYLFAFVDLEGFRKNDTILTLTFAAGSTGTVRLITTDINTDDVQTLEETVILGAASSEHAVHTYGRPVWTWAEDNLSAIATFTCTFEGHQEVVEATVEVEETAMVTKYTATVEFEGETYTNSKSVDTETKVLLKQLLLYYTQYRNTNNQYVSSYTSSAEYDIDRILADLKEVDPYLGDAWKSALDYWDDALYPFRNGYVVNGGSEEDRYGELPDGLPDDDSLVIVCLGFQLNQQTGEMQPELIGRLQVALNAWHKYPNAYIAVTGGGTAANSTHPENTEGGEMKKWLIAQGVPENKIICEDQAKNTYGNAANTYKILAEQYPQVTSIAMVSSTYHVPRGSVLFEIQFLQTAAENREECRVHVIANAGYYEPKSNYASNGGFEGFNMFSMQVASIPGISLGGWGQPTQKPALSAANDPLTVELASSKVSLGDELEIASATFPITIGDSFNEDYEENAVVSEITSDFDSSVAGVQTVTFSYTWLPGTIYEKTVTGQAEVVVTDQPTFIVRPDKASVVAGETLTLETSPQRSVTWSSSDPAIATVSANGVVTGVKAGKVIITATSTENAAVKAEAEIQVLFSDVADENAYYYDPVYWAYENGITTGTSATTFDPDGSCIRGQVVTFLHRYMGSPEPTFANGTPFKDVLKGKYWYNPVYWAYENGVTTGTSKTAFSPENKCSRAQIITFTWRAAGCPQVDNVPTYDDMTDSSKYYYMAVAWAQSRNMIPDDIITDNKFEPDRDCTRAETVAFLYGLDQYMNNH